MVNSGLPRPIYLVEEFGNRQNLGIPEASMMQAIANTLMIEKFQVHWTKSSNESVAFLVEMTKQCAQIYKVVLLILQINCVILFIFFVIRLGQNSNKSILS